MGSAPLTSSAPCPPTPPVLLPLVSAVSFPLPPLPRGYVGRPTCTPRDTHHTKGPAHEANETGHIRSWINSPSDTGAPRNEF